MQMPFFKLAKSLYEFRKVAPLVVCVRNASLRKHIFAIMSSKTTNGFFGASAR